ncbi:hypothetical protein [Chromobacterium vaccinii]|uniref:hypothetical protein n=1 Tax=Chromobacterium vaccinii TaxID=1108595 RepID=UPI0016431419|nr:hypothetical protein [Chromobacterium vaccinii]
MEVAQWLAANMPVFLPVIFLFHYLTHSIAEVANVVSNSDTLQLGHAYYLIDQLCGVGLCSRGDSALAIELANPRSGIYQTAWGSLIYDFGFAGAAFIWILLVSLITFFQSLQHYQVGPSVFVAAAIITLSPIENFLYNGLGLVQVFALFLMYFFVRLLGRVKFSLS